MTAASPPFVGLSAFTPHTAHYFTGRERFALTLAGTVLRSRIGVLFGASGCGKSSVLGAALPQALDAVLERPETREGFDDEAAASGEPFRLLQFRRWHPGFEERLFRAAVAKLGARHGTTLRQAIAEWTDRSHGPVVMVLDQFEEFLLYHPDPIATPFVQELSAVTADERLDAHVLFSLREDSVAPLDALRAVMPGILSSPIQLLPLDDEAAEQAIRRPVAEWSERNLGRPDGVAIEDELVTELLRQVRIGATGSIGAASGRHQTLVELPLLQLTLERLWLEEAKTWPITALRAETLRRLGGADGIVRDHLQATIGQLSPEQRALAASLMGYLVTPSGAKHAWRADDLVMELAAETTLAKAAAAQSMLGRMSAAVTAMPNLLNRVIDAALRLPRRLFGGRRASSGAGGAAAGEAVSDILGRLAAGRARILRTQPDPQGKGPLFELFHDALGAACAGLGAGRAGCCCRPPANAECRQAGADHGDSGCRPGVFVVAVDTGHPARSAPGGPRGDGAGPPGDAGW
jgi:hypothetical protein